MKDSERLPDPTPVVTDDRKAILVGLAGWVVALVVVLFVGFASPGQTWWIAIWTCTVGIILGGAGLAYTHHRHTRT